jgi:copper chaperone CopZ
MKEIKVVNIKCSGCASTVTKELEKVWVEDIEVCFSGNDSAKERTIKFKWDFKIVKEKLTSLWYPEIGSKEANSILKKAKSFVSCAIWKIN